MRANRSLEPVEKRQYARKVKRMGSAEQTVEAYMKAFETGGNGSARVNLYEADLFRNHCVVEGSSLGSLIQAMVGMAGGAGGLRTKRSGWS